MLNYLPKFETIKEADGLLAAIDSLPFEYVGPRKAKASLKEVAKFLPTNVDISLVEDLNPYFTITEVDSDVADKNVEGVAGAISGVGTEATAEYLKSIENSANNGSHPIAKTTAPVKRKNGEIDHSDEVDTPDTEDDTTQVTGVIYTSRVSFFLSWLKIQTTQLLEYLKPGKDGTSPVLNKDARLAIMKRHEAEDRALVADFSRSFKGEDTSIVLANYDAAKKAPANPLAFVGAFFTGMVARCQKFSVFLSKEQKKMDCLKALHFENHNGTVVFADYTPDDTQEDRELYEKVKSIQETIIALTVIPIVGLGVVSLLNKYSTRWNTFVAKLIARISSVGGSIKNFFMAPFSKRDVNKGRTIDAGVTLSSVSGTLFLADKEGKPKKSAILRSTDFVDAVKDYTLKCVSFGSQNETVVVYDENSEILVYAAIEDGIARVKMCNGCGE